MDIDVRFVEHTWNDERERTNNSPAAARFWMRPAASGGYCRRCVDWSVTSMDQRVDVGRRISKHEVCYGAFSESPPLASSEVSHD